jgi:uncharacterized membrane protein
VGDPEHRHGSDDDVGGHTRRIVTFLSFATTPARYAELRAVNRRGLGLMSVGGGGTVIGLSLRFSALEVATVVIVTPVFETDTLFAVTFGYMLNRRLEYFGKWVLLAIALSAMGTLAGTIQDHPRLRPSATVNLDDGSRRVRRSV